MIQPIQADSQEGFVEKGQNKRKPCLYEAWTFYVGLFTGTGVVVRVLIEAVMVLGSAI